MMTRRAANLSTKLASALAELEHLRGTGLPFEALQAMSAKDYLRRFEWDHDVFHVWGGSLHFTNLTPRLVADHRAKTKRDVKEIAKVRRALKRKAGQKRKSKPIPGSRGTKFKRKLNGRVEVRT